MSKFMAYELEPFGIKVIIIESGSINTNFRSEKAARATEDSPYYTMTQSTIETIEGMLKYTMTQSTIETIEGMLKQGIHPKEVARL